MATNTIAKQAALQAKTDAAQDARLRLMEEEVDRLNAELKALKAAPAPAPPTPAPPASAPPPPVTSPAPTPAPAKTTVAISGTRAQAEGSGGGITYLIFDVSRTGDTGPGSTADYKITGSGSNPATADDFENGVMASGKVWFGGGETAKQVWVGVKQDGLPEADETFTVTLSNPVGCVLGNAVAQGTIQNDDSVPAPAPPSPTPAPSPPAPTPVPPAPSPTYPAPTGSAPFPGMKQTFLDTFAVLNLYDEKQNPGGGPWKPYHGYGGDGESGHAEYGSFWPKNAESSSTSPANEPWVGVNKFWTPDLPDPFAAGPNGLDITMRKNPNPNDPRTTRGDGKKAQFITGLLTTYGKFEQTYGYFEVEGSMAMQQGAFPAMLWTYRPGIGDEIDLMEALFKEPGTARQTFHIPAKPGNDKGVQFACDVAAVNRFGCKWSRESLDFFANGKPTASFPNPGLHAAQYLCMNLAGGGWALNDVGIVAPQTMNIKRVQVWA